MPSEADACSRGRRTSRLHKSTNAAAPAAPKEKRRTERPRECHFERWAWNAVESKTNRKRSRTMSATEGCYGNQRRFGGDSRNWCVTIATASLRRALLHRLWQTQSFWASRAVHTRTRSFLLLLRRPLRHPTFFLSVKPRVKCNPLFVNIHSVPSQGSPASQAQVAYSTAYTDKQTRAIHTKTCSLTFLSSRLNTVTMTFISPKAEKKKNGRKTGQDAHLPETRARDGAWRWTRRTENTKNIS